MEKIIKTPRDLFSGVMQADPSSKLIYDHLTCALREGINSLKEPQKTKFVSQKIRDICKALPKYPEKAESITKTLAETNQREWTEALLSVFKLIKKPKDKKELKHLESFGEIQTDDERGNLAEIIFKSWVSFAFQNFKTGPGLFFSYLKFLIQVYEFNKSDSSIFQKIYCENPFAIGLVAISLKNFSGNKESTKWLLKHANHKDFENVFWKTIISLSGSKIIFGDLMHVIENFDRKHLENKSEFIIVFLVNMLYFAEKKKALDQFLSLVGKQFSEIIQSTWVLYLALMLIQKDQETVDFWKKNKDIFLKYLSNLAEPQKMKDIMLSADAFSNGDSEAIADLPLEFRKAFQEAAKSSK